MFLTSPFSLLFFSLTLLTLLSIFTDPFPFPIPSASTPSSNTHSTSLPLSNANHIFNSLQSALRQWSSSYHHNGMSFFLAIVPAYTRLYHGDSDSAPVRGLHWFSFEPEHAALFSKAAGGPSVAGERKKDTSVDMDVDSNPAMSLLTMSENTTSSSHPSPENEDISSRSGWLHEYQTLRPLRLLYIDGMSAAKSRIGTLDLQDLILLNLHPTRNPDSQQSEDLIPDADRLARTCEIIATRWNRKIDGVIRMEAGFELALCESQTETETDFHSKANPMLQTLHITCTKPRSLPLIGEQLNFNERDAGFSYFKAVASRYQGLGGARAVLDFDSFVSAFVYADSELEGPMPRIRDALSEQAADRMRQDLDAMVLQQRQRTEDERPGGRDWQAIADMLVSRYADLLQTMAEAPAQTTFRSRAEILLEQFIDYARSPLEVDIARCARQYLPNREPEGVAERAILGVSTRICETLVEVVGEEDLGVALGKIRELMAWLDWSTWKMCTACLRDEICWIPMWPLGSAQDREDARCLGEAPNPVDGSYWT